LTGLLACAHGKSAEARFGHSKPGKERCARRNKTSEEKGFSAPAAAFPRWCRDGRPGKELVDRARMHLRIVEQRMKPSSEQGPRTAEEHYQRGVTLMNVARWDEAREHLQKAKKLAPKTDYIFYALAALDCLTGEAESAMDNLKTAIHLRPENRYHARNDEDFAFLQEDPRFTELLYPEKDGTAG
jgi:tetratricopeptide (TPR) repeat protein